MTTNGHREWIVRNATRDTILVERMTVADSMLTRMRGLLGTTTLPSGEALLLRPARQVHSFFMRYALDLVFIDREGQVLLAIANFARNRLSPLVRAADAILEMPAGTLAEHPTALGDRLVYEPRAAAGEREADVA
jgi:uncharacterized membrane protein (UPF0127 family)